MTNKVEHNGQRHSVQEWARRTQLRPSTLHYRLNAGWPVGQALTTNALAPGYDRASTAPAYRSAGNDGQGR